MEAAVLLVFFIGLSYLLIYRPRQRQVLEHRQLVASLQVGEEIVTMDGIFGTITALEDDIAHVEVAPGVELRIAREAIGARTSTEPGDPAPGPEPTNPSES